MKRLLALSLLVSCAHGTAARKPASAWAAFVDDYQAAAFASSPADATSAGVHDFDALPDDLSRAAFEARIASLQAFAARLAAMDTAALPLQDAVDAKAIDGAIRGELLELTVVRGWEHNPMRYAGQAGSAVDSLIKRDFAPKADRLRSVIGRLRGTPALFAAARQNLSHPPREFTDLAIRMTSGSVGFFEGTVATWARDAAGADATLLAEFNAANGAAIAAVKEFAQWLKADLLPRSDGAYAIGEKTFLDKLRFDELVDLPIGPLRARGEAQLEKDRAAFLAIGAQMAPGKSPAEVVKLLSDDHPTEDGLIAAVAASVEEARQFAVKKDLITFPSEVRVRVTETPPYARDGGSASMSTPGPFEKVATEAFYYVTPVEKDWDAAHKESHLRGFNRPVMAVTNVHEAYPGHFTQFLYSSRWPTKARKQLECGTNVEGWAHYTEQMMVDQGFGGGDPRFRLGQLSDALLRDCRYLVGIKLHTEGMTVAEGAKVFEERCFQQSAVAYEESRRGAYNPTYLYYTLGKLMIQDLAAEVMQKRGWSLKQFHDAFVAQGGLPIPLVRRLLLEQ